MFAHPDFLTTPLLSGILSQSSVASSRPVDVGLSLGAIVHMRCVPFLGCAHATLMYQHIANAHCIKHCHIHPYMLGVNDSADTGSSGCFHPQLLPELHACLLAARCVQVALQDSRSEEHTSELQSL